MKKNIKKLKEFEKEILLQQDDIPFDEKIKIFEGLWNEGVSLGVLPLKNPFEGIETDIKLAKILNSCSSNSSQK
jgi:hypothetical protein